MEIEKLISTVKNLVGVEIKNGVYLLKTEATFLNGSKIVLQLEQKDKKWYLHDNKATLKYMNELYELSSSDVKMCISNVLKIYGFSITGGLMQVEITNEEKFGSVFFDFLMCISQLTNMFAFFDKP